MKKLFILLPIVLLTMACLLITGRGPEEGAREFYKAFLNFDEQGIMDRVCDDYKEVFEFTFEAWNRFKEENPEEFREFEEQINSYSISDLSFNAVRKEGDSVLVEVSGKSGIPDIISQEGENSLLVMVHEEGEWKLCGSVTP